MQCYGAMIIRVALAAATSMIDIRNESHDLKCIGASNDVLSIVLENEKY